MRLLLQVHRYFGLLASLTILLIAGTGLLLVHGKRLGLKNIPVRLTGPALPAAADAFDLLTVRGGVLAATRQGVFLREGGRWRRVLHADAKRLAAVSGELLAFAAEGLFSSGDGGRTWAVQLRGGEARAAAETSSGLVAATTEGVFVREAGRWRRLASLGPPAAQVREIVADDGALMLASKEGLHRLAAGGRLEFVALPLDGTERRGDLQKLVMDLHTGDFFGPWFTLVTDLTGLALVALSLSGIYLWYRPWIVRRRARSSAKRH